MLFLYTWFIFGKSGRDVWIYCTADMKPHLFFSRGKLVYIGKIFLSRRQYSAMRVCLDVYVCWNIIHMNWKVACSVHAAVVERKTSWGERPCTSTGKKPLTSIDLDLQKSKFITTCVIRIGTCHRQKISILKDCKKTKTRATHWTQKKMFEGCNFGRTLWKF